MLSFSVSCSFSETFPCLFAKFAPKIFLANIAGRKFWGANFCFALGSVWSLLMFEEYPLPQIPKDTPSLGWRHSGAACAVLEFQSGNAILAQVQGIRLGLSGESTQQIEHISPVVCTQQTLKSSYHCYTKFLSEDW